MKILRFTFLIFLLLLGTSRATNYYVDATKGNDNNSGSINNPWKTFNAILIHKFNGGDVISFQGGQTFNNAHIYYNTVSTRHLLDNVKFTSYGSGKAIIIPNTANYLRIDYQDGMTFENLEFAAGDTTNVHGFLDFNKCNDLTFNNCTFDGKGNIHGYDKSAVMVSSFAVNTMTVTYCVFKNQGVTASYSSGYQHAIYITGDNVTFEYNTISNIPDGEGLKNNGGSLNPTNWTVRYNYFDNITQSGIFLQAGHNINIYNNIFNLIPNYSNGIALSHDNSSYPHYI